MTMKARVRTDSCGNITVHMEGGLDYENSGNFRNQLDDLLNKNPASTITIDMNQLDFVGSSGIGFFVETIKIFNRKKEQIKLSNVKNEFIKVFKLFDGNLMDIIINEFDDDNTELLSQRFANRKQTYQN